MSTYTNNPARSKKIDKGIFYLLFQETTANYHGLRTNISQLLRTSEGAGFGDNIKIELESQVKKWKRANRKSDENNKIEKLT